MWREGRPYASSSSCAAHGWCHRRPRGSRSAQNGGCKSHRRCRPRRRNTSSAGRGRSTRGRKRIFRRARGARCRNRGPPAPPRTSPAPSRGVLVRRAPGRGGMRHTRHSSPRRLLLYCPLRPGHAASAASRRLASQRSKYAPSGGQYRAADEQVDDRNSHELHRGTHLQLILVCGPTARVRRASVVSQRYVKSQGS